MGSGLGYPGGRLMVTRRPAVWLAVLLVAAVLSLVPGVAEAHSRRTPQSRVAPSGQVWERLAQCESGGNWQIRGRTYSGGLQFNRGTWRSVGGTGVAADASKEEQIARATVLHARRGWSPWPGCSRRLRLR